MERLQVRFHPLRPEILASGSLDHEVRLWDANTSECIGSRDFCNVILTLSLVTSAVVCSIFLTVLFLLP